MEAAQPQGNSRSAPTAPPAHVPGDVVHRRRTGRRYEYDCRGGNRVTTLRCFTACTPVASCGGSALSSDPRSAGNAAATVVTAAVNGFVQSSRSLRAATHLRFGGRAAPRERKVYGRDPLAVESHRRVYAIDVVRRRSAAIRGGSVGALSSQLFIRLDASSAIVRRIVNESHTSASARGI